MEKDIKFQRILLNREIPEPSDDIDDKIMASISKVIVKKTVNNRSLILAWIFLLIGVATGVIISTILIRNDIIILGFTLSEYGVIIQVFCSIVILLLFERLFNLTYEIWEKHFELKTKSYQI
jgi:hypothetical protein